MKKSIWTRPSGLFVNYYEPDPLDGEYPGIEGDRKKISILNTALDIYRTATKGEHRDRRAQGAQRRDVSHRQIRPHLSAQRRFRFSG